MHLKEYRVGGRGEDAKLEVNRMLYLKSCPRCKGALYLNRDIYGTYKECLQCGYMLDIQKPNALLSAQTSSANLDKKVA